MLQCAWSCLRRAIREPSKQARESADSNRRKRWRALRSFMRARTSVTESITLQAGACWERSEEHTSELQSRGHLVCRLLLEKKNWQIALGAGSGVGGSGRQRLRF